MPAPSWEHPREQVLELHLKRRWDLGVQTGGGCSPQNQGVGSSRVGWAGAQQEAPCDKALPTPHPNSLLCAPKTGAPRRGRDHRTLARADAFEKSLQKEGGGALCDLSPAALRLLVLAGLGAAFPHFQRVDPRGSWHPHWGLPSQERGPMPAQPCIFRFTPQPPSKEGASRRGPGKRGSLRRALAQPCPASSPPQGLPVHQGMWSFSEDLACF